MATDLIGSTTAANGNATLLNTANDRAALNENFEMFLQLLTTQLQNQSPLDPMDADKFTEQLVQYSSVEQQMKQNDNLEKILESLAAANMGALVSYVGREIEAAGDTTQLRNGAADWVFNSSGSGEGRLTVRNAAGSVVYSQDISLTRGESRFTWDGITDSGRQAPDGSYTLALEGADASGNALTFSTRIAGVVDEIDLSSGEAMLRVGGITVPVGSVSAIRTAD